MGFHFLDILVVALIGLALFGPKALQSMARGAGKGVGQAKDMKDKLMSELPMDEISKVTENIPQVPLNSRQAIQMLMTSEAAEKKSREAKSESEKKSETAVVEGPQDR